MPPTRRRLSRIVGRVGRVVALVYLGFLLVTSVAQEWLIFPGHRTQGQPSAVIVPGPGEALWRLETADGTPVVAHFSPARRRDGSADPLAPTRPTMLFFYGNGMSAADCRGFAEWFTRELGVNFVVGDYPGYGMSGGRPSADGCHSMADAVYARAAADPRVDPSKFVAAGLSLGSGVATALTARRPAVAAVVVFSGYTTMADMARRVLPFLPAGAVLRHRFDNVTPLRRITVPTFLAHGRNDGLIPLSMHAALAAAAAGPVTTHVNDAGHNDFFETDPDALIAALRAFLDGAFPPPARESPGPAAGG